MVWDDDDDDGCCIGSRYDDTDGRGLQFVLVGAVSCFKVSMSCSSPWAHLFICRNQISGWILANCFVERTRCECEGIYIRKATLDGTADR